MHSYALECTAVVVQALNVLPRHTRACVEGCVCVYCVPLSVCPAGSEPDWVLDLVATGFNKPDHLFGHSMRSKEDVDAAADAFKEKYTRVRGFTARHSHQVSRVLGSFCNAPNPLHHRVG